MVRTMPTIHNEEIELYIRTYYSLLRSSEPIRIRSLEETHAAMNSSLHQQASSAEIDISALTYSAMRLPDCMPTVKLMIMGQMADVFTREGYPNVEEWQTVRARARRRKFYFDEESGCLAAFIASVSDIDDIIPCMTTYQIEWNKMYMRIAANSVRAHLSALPEDTTTLPADVSAELQGALGLGDEDYAKLQQVWSGASFARNMRLLAEGPIDMQVRVLGSGLSDYRRSVQQWWRALVDDSADIQPAKRPIYFISSNPHSVPNVLSGFAQAHREAVLDFVRQENPEGLAEELKALPNDASGQMENLLYYASRLWARWAGERGVRAEMETQVGIRRLTEPHCLDVEVQMIELNKLDPERFDPRLDFLSAEDREILRESNALIFNIDYPLGMAAYHIFSQVSTAGGRILGMYILGKAATLNGRVGDVMIPNVVYDEHSRNSFLFRNCFTAQDVAPLLNFGTVFDNQKAVTVRGTILQNRRFMGVFYHEGYTDIEMESGPYLAAVYEDVYPQRYPIDEIVNLFINVPYDLGVIHYASDTPISRRQALLSKSLSYFGVDATYAGTVAVLRRVLAKEVRRLRNERTTEPNYAAA
jgi:hypothetical protein